MKASEITPEIRFNENTFRLVGYLLVALMLTCAASTVLSLVARLVPGWQPWYLLGICFVVALDSLYSKRIFKHLSLFSSEWLSLAGAQVFILLIVLRLAIGLSHGPRAFTRELGDGWFKFFLSFFTVEYLVAFGIMAVTWLLCLTFADLLDEMGLDAELARQDAGAAIPKEGSPPREQLLGLVFSIGNFLVMLTALLRLDFRATLAGNFETAILNVSPLENGGAGTLLYFIFALALFSETQFILLHTRWSLQRIPANKLMAGRWVLYSLIFLVFLAILASLLPTDYSLGFLATLGYLVNILSSILFFIAQIVIAILLFITSLPFLLFGRSSPLPSQATQPKPPELPDALTRTTTPFPWLEVLKSLLFWGLFLGVLVFALIQYLRQHEDVLNTLRKMPGLNWLAKFWDWLRETFQATQKRISNAISTGWQRLRPRRSLSQSLSRWINLRRLGPRQKVFFFYQAFLRRSGESGLPRSLSQTPLEFASRLDSALPEAEPDIDALTGAFIEARYTPRPIEPEKANRVRETWEHLRKFLRGRNVG